MNSMLPDFSPAALVKAIEDNFIASWANLGRLGGELHQADGIVRIANAIPRIPYNGVLHTDWQDTNVMAGIAANIAYFRARKAQMMWAILPSTQPPDLARYLEAQGFTRWCELIGMAAELSRLPEPQSLPPSTEIHEVDDLQRLRQYAELVVEKWQLAPDDTELIFALHRQWGLGPDKSGRRWLAWQNGLPVAKAFLSLAAGVAGIYGVSTVPEARRQGLGRAVTIAALAAAQKLGFHISVLHSTAMGLGVYQSLGFEEYCTISIYVLQ
jgi:GNAT superfamily N-acetyltransferase